MTRVRLLAVTGLAAWVVGLMLHRSPDAPRESFLALAGLLLVSPTVHPWYALILLVFLPFLPPATGEPRRQWLAVWPWLYLSAALPLSYLTYLDPLDFRELEWVRRTEWLPTLALLLLWIIYSGKPLIHDTSGIIYVLLAQ